MSEHVQDEYNYWRMKVEDEQVGYQNMVEINALQIEHWKNATDREREALEFQRSSNILKFRLALVYLMSRTKDYSEDLVRLVMKDHAKLVGLDLDAEIEALKALPKGEAE